MTSSSNLFSNNDFVSNLGKLLPFQKEKFFINVKSSSHVNTNAVVEKQKLNDNANNAMIVIPTKSLGGGDHYEDDPLKSRWSDINSSLLPREVLHRIVAEGNCTRPNIRNNIETNLLKCIGIVLYFNSKISKSVIHYEVEV